MDLSKSQWNKFGVPEKDVKVTTKKFFGLYLCKVDIQVPGMSMVKWGDGASLEDFKIYIAKKKKDAMAHNYNMSYSDWVLLTTTNSMKSVNATQIYELYKLGKSLEGAFRMRIERNTLIYYAVDTLELHDILNKVQKHVNNNIRTIYQPVSLEQSIKLEDNLVYSKTIDYKFKVTLGSGRFDPDIRQQILDYLNALGDEIKITDKVKLRLGSVANYIHACHLYTNDTGNILFLTMMAPKFVKKIYKVEKLA